MNILNSNNCIGETIKSISNVSKYTLVIYESGNFSVIKHSRGKLSNFCDSIDLRYGALKDYAFDIRQAITEQGFEITGKLGETLTGIMIDDKVDRYVQYIVLKIEFEFEECVPDFIVRDAISASGHEHGDLPTNEWQFVRLVMDNYSKYVDKFGEEC